MATAIIILCMSLIVIVGVPFAAYLTLGFSGTLLGGYAAKNGKKAAMTHKVPVFTHYFNEAYELERELVESR